MIRYSKHYDPQRVRKQAKQATELNASYKFIGHNPSENHSLLYVNDIVTCSPHKVSEAMPIGLTGLKSPVWVKMA